MLLATLTSLLAAAPTIAVLSTAEAGPTTELRFQPADGPLTPRVASLDHIPGATVKGALVSQRRVAVVTQHEARRDPSFAAALFRLAPDRPTTKLLDGVVLASAPVVTGAHTVVVQRGAAGDELPGALRVDHLSVDEVHLETGRVRPLLRFDGSQLIPTVLVGRELVVYRVGPKGADVVAVHLDTLAVRPLASGLPPLAFDFAASTDGAVYFTLGDPPARRWTVQRVASATGERTEVAAGPDVALLPAVLAQRLAISAGPGRGLVFADTGERAIPSLGAGYERVVATAGAHAIVLHEVPSDFNAAFAVDLRSGRGVRYPTAPRALLAIAGVLP